MSAVSKEKAQRWIFVAAAILAAFVITERAPFGVFVVPIQESFELTRAQAVLPVSVSMLVMGLGSPFGGALMDLKGHEWTCFWG